MCQARRRFGSRGLLGALAILTIAAPAAAAPQLAIRFEGGALGGRPTVVVRFLDLADASGASSVAAAVYVPSGYSVALGGAVGEAIGEASGFFVAPGRTERFSGRVEVATAPAPDPSDPCLSTTRSAWLRIVPLTPTSVPPVYVGLDQVTPDPANPVAQWRLEPCLRAVQREGQLRILELGLAHLFVNPTSAGTYRWAAVFTPSSPLSPAIESRSLARLPVRVTLNAVPAGSKTRPLVDLNGTVSEGGAPPPRTSIDLFRGKSAAALRQPGVAPNMFLGTVPAFRRFDVTVRNRGGSFYRVRAWIDDAVPRPAPADACAAPSLAPGGCTSASLAGFRVFSPIVRVRAR